MIEQLYVAVARLFNYRLAASPTGSVELLCLECSEDDWHGDPIWTSFRKTSLDGGFDFSVLELLNVITNHEELVHDGVNRPRDKRA